MRVIRRGPDAELLPKSPSKITIQSQGCADWLFAIDSNIMPADMSHQPDNIFAGTQVVSLVEVRGPNNSLVHPRGAVGVVTRTPAVAGEKFLVRFPDGFETSFTKEQMDVLKHFKDRLPEGRPNSGFELEEYIIYRCVVETRPRPQKSERIKRTAPLMPERLDWHSAIGNFMLNFGTLDCFLLDCLEASLPMDEFAKVKSWHFRDRLEILKKHLARCSSPNVALNDLEHLFCRVEPIRELRNHIAHGTMRLGLTADQSTWAVTLSLPRDLDGSYSTEARHLSFEELERALTELPGLIEEFKKLSDLLHNTANTERAQP